MTSRMYCISCRAPYWLASSGEGGACADCFDRAGETVEELQREIEELKAKVAFLTFWTPFDHQNQPCYTDVVLVAASEDGPSGSTVPIPAHKAVLASRSPVFKAMLENEMVEKRTSTIKISDISYDVLWVFINYLYTAEACLEEKMACNLLELGEKYQIKHLKAYCEKFLISNLNWDNSVMSYVLAHRQNAKHLLRAALSLITENMSEFTTRDEYMVLVENDPRLLVEIYEAYLSKKVKQPKFHPGNQV